MFAQEEEKQESHIENLINHTKNIMEVAESMKNRQFQGVTNVKKVYGEGSPNKTTLKSFNKICKCLYEICKKLLPKEKKIGSSRSGFLSCVYIREELANFLGIQRGSDLWPEGERPIFVRSHSTTFIVHYVRSRNLIDEQNKKFFYLDEKMLNMYNTLITTPGPNGTTISKTVLEREALDTDFVEVELNGKLVRTPKIQYTTVQKYNRHFFLTKAQSGPVKVTEKQQKFLDDIGAKLKYLGTLKKTLDLAISKREKAESSFANVQASVESKIIPMTAAIVRQSEESIILCKKTEKEALTKYLKAARETGI